MKISLRLFRDNRFVLSPCLALRHLYPLEQDCQLVTRGFNSTSWRTQKFLTFFVIFPFVQCVTQLYPNIITDVKFEYYAGVTQGTTDADRSKMSILRITKDNTDNTTAWSVSPTHMVRGRGVEKKCVNIWKLKPKIHCIYGTTPNCNSSPCFGPLWHIIKGSQVITKTEVYDATILHISTNRICIHKCKKYKDIKQELLKISLSTSYRTKFTRI